MNGDLLPFNPLDKRNLGDSVVQAMLRCPVVGFDELQPFKGAGIYAIYYTGTFKAYKPLVILNENQAFKVPIYIGKAVPKGARKGSSLELDPGNVLFARLLQHKKSIEEAKNLEITDFHCRYLLVDDIWIPLGETLMIARFNPLWNIFIDGFGNHDPGSGRHMGLRPKWDVIHPGRTWAARCQPREESADQILREIGEFLRSNPPIDE